MNILCPSLKRKRIDKSDGGRSLGVRFYRKVDVMPEELERGKSPQIANELGFGWSLRSIPVLAVFLPPCFYGFSMCFIVAICVELVVEDA